MNRRQFLGSTALAASVIPLFGAGATATAAPRGKQLLPIPLNRGDTVGLVSPSSATDDSFSLQLARETMEALGLKVKAGAHLGDRYGYLAGTDAERASDINAMFADKSIKAENDKINRVLFEDLTDAELDAMYRAYYPDGSADGDKKKVIRAIATERERGMEFFMRARKE